MDDLQTCLAAGGRIVSALPKYHTKRAWIPRLACEQIAARDATA
jgi:hypothetical protein